jgi:outer membrane protein assembly factor BamB
VGPVSRSAASIGSDGSVYLPSIDGNFYAVAPPTERGGRGAIGWAFDFTAHNGSGPIPTGVVPVGGNGVGGASSAAIGRDGTLYVGANNSNFYAVRVDGSLKWMFEAEREVAGIWADPALAADERTVYFGANKGGVYAVDTASGARRWQFPVEGSLYGGMTLDRTGTLFYGSSMGRFYALNAANGQPYFDYDAQAFPGIWTAPCILPNGSVVVSTRQGQVLLFSA